MFPTNSSRDIGHSEVSFAASRLSSFLLGFLKGGPIFIFSWEPALGLANSQEAEGEGEVQKKSLPFSPIISDF